MPGQCAGAWTANDHTAKALNHKQQYIMETEKSQCILSIWAGSRSAFSRKLPLCDADCAIFLLSVAVAEGVFLYRTKSRNALLAVITFAVLLCFRPRRRRAEGKELNSRTDNGSRRFGLLSASPVGKNRLDFCAPVGYNTDIPKALHPKEAFHEHYGRQAAARAG